MEINRILVGLKLIEIQKVGDKVNLYFKRAGHAEKVELSFKGLLFETPTSTIGKQVYKAYLSSVPGFKARTQLEHQKLNPSEYKQLLIQMKGSTEDYKIELICVSKAYKLTTLNKEITTADSHHKLTAE